MCGASLTTGTMNVSKMAVDWANLHLSRSFSERVFFCWPQLCITGVLVERGGSFKATKFHPPPPPPPQTLLHELSSALRGPPVLAFLLISARHTF